MPKRSVVKIPKCDTSKRKVCKIKNNAINGCAWNHLILKEMIKTPMLETKISSSWKMKKKKTNKKNKTAFLMNMQ